MLTLQEEFYMKEIYADIVDNLPDNEMMELIEELDGMDKEDQFDYLIRIAKVENPREEKLNVCTCAIGCNYCLMTEW